MTNYMYPNYTIVDNFFDDPDAVVELSKQIKWYPNDGRYPGERSEPIHQVNKNFFNYVGKKLLNIFFEEEPNYWSTTLKFQRILPVHTDQYNIKNRGWVHKDNCIFGGIIYLNKNPEPDTGTSMYRLKNGYSTVNIGEIEWKKKLYLNKLSPEEDEQYNQYYDEIHNQFIETVKVENVYNRLVIIGNGTFHGVPTFGTKERLTLTFFTHDINNGKLPPLCRV